MVSEAVSAVSEAVSAVLEAVSEAVSEMALAVLEGHRRSPPNAPNSSSGPILLRWQPQSSSQLEVSLCTYSNNIRFYNSMFSHMHVWVQDTLSYLSRLVVVLALRHEVPSDGESLEETPLMGRRQRHNIACFS